MITPRVAASGSGCQQVVDEPGGGLADHQPVHPLRPGADGGTQPGGAELQPAVEPLGQFVVGLRRAGSASSARMSASGSAASHAASRIAAEIAHGKSVRNSTSGRGPTWEITSAAAIAPSCAHSASERRRV